MTVQKIMKRLGVIGDMSENVSEKEQKNTDEKQAESSEATEKKELAKEHEVEVEDKDSTERQMERAVANVFQSEFHGPIPPPNIIKGYEEVVPGAADRIITMAENQAKHRQTMEATMIKAESRDSLLGVLFAFILGVGCLVASAIIVVAVPDKTGAISGAAVGVTGMVSIIATFINGTRSTSSKNKKES